MKSIKYGFASLLLFLSSVTSASAFGYRTCEGVPLRLQGNTLQLNWNTTSFSGSYQTAIQNAITQFNNHPSPFAYSGNPSTTQALGNGRSEIWGSTDNGILQGAPAIAYSYWDCYWSFGWVRRMKEGDVIFDYRNANNNSWLWTPFQTKAANMMYAGSKRLLNTTAVHEFGHAAGMLHEARFYNVMGSDFTHINTSGSAASAYVGADTGAGLRFLYGEWSGGPEDLGVAHWYRTGQSGEYSTHSRTRILSSTGIELSRFNSGSEPVYRVSRGQQVKVEFTYENVGKSAQTQRPVNFYISTDDNITTADRLISSGYWVSCSASGHFTAQLTVTIPTTNLPSGSQNWLGVIINPNNNAPIESRRENNSSYIRIYIN